MIEDQPPAAPTGRGLSRRRLLERASIVVATAGLAGCGVSEQRQTVSPDVDAVQFPPLPPSQQPLNCHIFAFFRPDEAQTVDAITARLIPGSPSDPGAREACVTAYIDQKLARFGAFATPTYFQPPFAKPVDTSPTGAQPGSAKEILVSKDELPRYGFQSSLTPQQSYRLGLTQLDAYTRSRHGAAFSDLPEQLQDIVLETLEKANPSPPGGRPQAERPRRPGASPQGSEGQARSGARVTGAAVARPFFTKPSAYGFFAMLQDDANEGFLADPSYGGNRDFAGWKLVRYPGAQRAVHAVRAHTRPATSAPSRVSPRCHR